MQELSDALKEKKLKVTPQRLAIYKLLKNTKSHPTAEIIYRSLEPEFPTMSLATVYKTLNSLKSVGLLQDLNAGEESLHYDAVVKPHPHLVCNTCHKITDYEKSGVLDELKREIEKDGKFKITGEQIYFYGKCEDCQ